MTNSKQIRILAAAGAAVALAGVAAGTGSAQEQPSTLELVQRSTETRTGFVDTPPRRREGPGDLFTVSGPVRDSSGRRTGRSDAMFAQTSAKHAQGSATFALPSGTLVASGALDNSGRSARGDRLAIVGGTGAYAGASGTLELTYERRATRFRFTLAP
jgi:hypothetical protein